MHKNVSGKITVAALLVIGALLPQVVASSFLKDLMILTLMHAYLAISWNILSGYAGQFSFGHAAFYGIGGYTSSLLFAKLGLTPWVGMFAGAALAGLVGGIVGYVSFRYRVKGAFFALVTFAVAGMLQVITTNWNYVGGSVGLLVPLKGHAPGLFQFRGKEPYYYVILVMVVGALYIAHWLRHSRIGFYWAAIREEESAASVLGVDVLRYKVIAMVISSAMTALGGTFYAQWQLYLDPEIAFAGPTSITILLGAIIGGVGTVWGPLLGAVALTALSEFTKELFRQYPGMDVMLYGALLMVIVMFLPEGLYGLRKHFRRRPTGGSAASAERGAA